MSVQTTAQTAETTATTETTGAEVSANTPPGGVETQLEASTSVDESGWDEKTKTYIKSLRQEAAKNRTKAKELETQFKAMNDRFSGLETGLKKALGVETDELSPEDKLGAISAQNEEMAFKNAVLETALGHGLGVGQLEMLEFMILKRADALEEGQELTDEDLSEIIGKVKLAEKAFSGASSVSGSLQPASTQSSGSMTVEKFAKMSIAEKSLLYSKDPNTYNSLMAVAKEKRMLGR